MLFGTPDKVMQAWRAGNYKRCRAQLRAWAEKEPGWVVILVNEYMPPKEFFDQMVEIRIVRREYPWGMDDYLIAEIKPGANNEDSEVEDTGQAKTAQDTGEPTGVSTAVSSVTTTDWANWLQGGLAKAAQIVDSQKP